MTIRPLTILMVDRAGAQSIWSLMGMIRQAAQKRGHIVHTLRWDDGRGTQEDCAATGPEHHVISVPPKKHSFDTLVQHRRFAPEFDQLLRKIQPDILHTNFIVPGGLAMRIARRAGVPRIIATRHELAGSLSPHLLVWSRYCQRFADHLVHVSSTVAESYGLSSAPQYSQGQAPRNMVIHNGIDLDSLQRVESYPRASNERVVVVAGRMVAEKGQARALAAFALAAQRDPKLRLELIGDGPERALLERRAQQVGLADRVDFPGWRPREETFARMKSAWCVLVPSSSIQEGFGLVLVEAMALGVPVVASDIPVFREVSEMGFGVALADSNNSLDLAEAMLAPGGPSSFGSIKLGTKPMQDAYVDLYESCLWINSKN